MEDKSDPLMSQATIQNQLEENQAKITPLNAEGLILTNITLEFKQEIEILCDKTE
jgi:hypothetical protein